MNTEVTVAEAQHILLLEEALRNVQANELITRGHERYRELASGEIKDVDFQKETLSLMKRSHGEWSCELPTGSGKTIVQAMVSAEKVSDGPIIYVCPNRVSLGDFQEGIINKFVRVLTHKLGRPPLLGKINEATVTKEVLFFTPGSLVGLSSRDEKLFELLMQKSSCLILDESHHFPNTQELKFFGAIDEISTKYFSNGRPTFRFTATHYRLDGAELPKLDHRVTYQTLCSQGWVPEIFGVSVFLDIQCPQSCVCGSSYDLRLVGKERKKYYDALADCVVRVYNSRPKPMAGFFYRVKDAEEVQKRVNRVLSKPVHVLSHRTPKIERDRIKEEIMSGVSLGYFTCNLGAESLDIPQIEVIHLIRRSRSINYVVQAMGRATRNYRGKKNALLVDYHVHEKKILQAAVGFDHIVKNADSSIRNVVNGGALVSSKSDAVFVGHTVSEQKKLVYKIRESQSSEYAEEMQKYLLTLARSGKRAPRKEEKGYMYLRFCRSRGRSRFTEILESERPDWFPEIYKKVKFERLVELAKSGKPKPERHSELGNFLSTLSASPNEYAVVRELRPEWFGDLRMKKIREEILELAKTHKGTLGTRNKLGKALNTLWCRKHITENRIFLDTLKKIRPDWYPCDLKKLGLTYQNEILRIAETGGRLKDEKLKRYLIASIRRNLDFRKKIENLRPDWFPRIKCKRKREELLEHAKSGGNKPRYDSELGRVLTYVKKEHPLIYKRIFEYRPDWRMGSTLEQDKEILNWAESGAARPPYYSEEGQILTGRLSASPEFKKKVIKMRPDWFVACRIKSKKDELLQLARSGVKKPEEGTALRRALDRYIAKDTAFKEKIQEAAPLWFRSARDEVRKKYIRTLLARSGKVLSFTDRAFIRIRPDFYSEVKRLRPDLFRDCVMEKVKRRKEEIINIAKQGGDRSKEITREVSRFCWEDKEFKKMLKRIVPHWFERRRLK